MSSYYNQAKNMGNSITNRMGNMTQGAVKYIPQTYSGVAMSESGCSIHHPSYYLSMTILMLLLGSSLVMTMNSIFETSDYFITIQIIGSVVMIIACLISLSLA